MNEKLDEFTKEAAGFTEHNSDGDTILDDEYVYIKTNDSSYEYRLTAEQRPVPQVPPVYTRTSKNKLNEELMPCLVQCLAKYKVSANDILGIVKDVANIVFHQKWKLSNTDTSEAGNNDDDSEIELEVVIGETNVNSAQKRKMGESEDMCFVMPTRRCLNMYLEDAAYMNLAVVADVLKNNDKAKQIITVGLDDTTKSAGYRKLDVKTDHITVVDRETMKKKTYTTGYIENKSHSGKDSAETYHFKLTCLAVLAG